MTLKQKLVCPYCKAKQEYKAKDYFAPATSISENIQCDNCDEYFNAAIKNGEVISYSNLLTLPQ
jgi:hypothetical protein